jgi:hypothetical protein
MQEYRTMMSNRVTESVMMERRITLRLLGYWEKLRGTRSMPAEQDVDPADLHDLWDCCMMVRVKDVHNNDYQYSYIGQSIMDTYSLGVQGEEEGGSITSLNGGSLVAGCKKVIETAKPLLDEGEFYNRRNELVKYRLCLLPLGDGDVVQAVFGGMRFKVYTS